MTTLIFDMQTAFMSDIKDKAPEVLEKLGIKWAEAHPQPIFAEWKFVGCTNVPDVLPSYVRIKEQPAPQNGAAVMPCGAVVSNVYEAYDAGKRAAEQPAQQQEWIETACALIKAADDAAADRDYMLDSNDCIRVLRGEWKGGMLNDCPPAPQPPAQPAREPLTPAQKIALAEDWFSEDWAITKAVGMMVEYEMRIAHGVTKGNT